MAEKIGNTFKRTKILAGVGPATHSYEKLEKLAMNGVNGFRMNFSHGNNEERDEQIKWIRDISAKLEKPVAILQDLQGPKIRLGEVGDPFEVKTGDELSLTYGIERDGFNLPVQYNLATKMKVGERLYIFDGKIRTTVTEVMGDTVKVRVENNGTVMSRKGINVPDTNFSGDILTEKDIRDMDYGAQQDFDYVAMSFIQSAEDIQHGKKLLQERGSRAKIIAKIETRQAIDERELERIVRVADGVMVARGDLAVEVGAEVVPIVQRRIIGLCQKYGKLSIVATQMMASMVENPEPTRAEVSDVANAVILGADCLMLSDETAMGKYPVETVASMKKVILYTQEHAPVEPIYYREGEAYSERQDAISSAALTLASQLGVTAIVAETKSGATAASIAAHRPSMPIISVTSDQRVAQQLTLMHATKSFVRPDGDRAGLSLARELKAENFFGDGTRPTTVVVVSGKQPGLIGGTDTIRVRVLE